MKRPLRLSFLMLMVCFLSACDLTESVRDTALQQDALQTGDASERTVAPVYNRMQLILERHNWMNNLQGVSSIEQIVPFRGGTDWFDGGRFIEMHQHTWTPTHPTINDVWTHATQGLGRGAIAERTISDLDGDPALAYEVRGLKAVYNFWLLDLYNVAFDKRPQDVGTPNMSTVYREREAVEYLINELDEIEEHLPSVNDYGPLGVTRFSREAALALKARLLLNKAVYADRYAPQHTHDGADLNAVVSNASRLIDGGRFDLERRNYFYLFSRENESSPEPIFSFNQQPETGGTNRLAYFHASRNRHGSVLYPNKTGSDGGAVTQDFYDLWEDHREDPRFYHRFLPDSGSVTDGDFRWNRGIMIGQQYGIVLDADRPGDYIRDADGNLSILPLWDTARSGEPMVYTREVGLHTDRGHLAGARSLKWEIDKTTPGSASSVNIPVLRLGEMYLTRAEAYARQGNWSAALQDVNTLREARGARQLTASELSDLSHLEREWLFEMYQEHNTRTVQIRFGTFGGTWRDKPVSDPSRRVFPIPQNAIDAAQGSPGYLEQNRGY